jgi:TonB family protein
MGWRRPIGETQARRAWGPVRAFSTVGAAGAVLATLAVAIPRVAHAQQGMSGAPSTGVVELPPAVDPAPPPPKATLTPPSILHFEHADYPKAAEAAGIESNVVLVLDIDDTGKVTHAEATPKVGNGFDEAAEAAALKFTFEPARRGVRPIAARIKYLYKFTLAKTVPLPAAQVHVPVKNLRGKVLAAGVNTPIGGATVTLRAPSGESLTSVVGPDGTWSFEDLAAGTYHLVAKANLFDPDQVDESVVVGKATQIVFHLFPEAGEEITVKGARPAREVTRETITEEEINRIPGTNGDAIRSLENLPGVARPPALLGLLIVRGSAPADTQVFVDGTAIPIIYHFGGLSAVVPTEVLDKIDFYPGNFSAQYGRATGGIVDVGVRDPKQDNKFHGFAEVDLIDARVMVEGPIADGWTFLAAGRRSYFDLWLGPVLSGLGAGVTAAPVYYDYQALVEKKWSSRESFRVMFFGSDDRFALTLNSVDAADPGLSGGLSDHTAFWRLQGRYLNKIDANTEVKITPAIGHDTLDFGLGSDYLHVGSYELSLRAEVSRKLAKHVTMNLGLDWQYLPYDIDVRFPPFNTPGQPTTGPFLSRPAVVSSASGQINRPAVYAEAELTPWRGARIVPGVRLDYSSNSGSWDFAPRLIARQDLTTGFPRTTLKGGMGLFYQPPQPQDTDPVFGQPGVKSNRATQYDVGVEQEVTHHVEVSLEGYYKLLDNLVSTGYYNEGHGRAYGLETLIRWKPDGRFFGWIAYTLSRSQRTQPPSDVETLYEYDQTHILTVLGSYKLGRGWEFGARFRLVSGNLYTPSTYGFYDENAGSQLALPSYPAYNSRLPLFTQLDLRVDKTWQFQHWKLGAYLDVQNVYNRGNAEAVGYNYNNTQQSLVTGIPILPNLGLRADF